MNETDLATAAATEAIKAVGQDVYRDAVQPAAQAGGHALGTLMNAFNMLLAPLERAQLRSEAKTERLRQELTDGFKEIPEERRVEPPLEIVGPTLESLKYVTDEELQKLFVQLLVSSMDSKQQSATHRAFVKVLQELNPVEAKMIKQATDNEMTIAVTFESLTDDTEDHLDIVVPFAACTSDILSLDFEWDEESNAAYYYRTNRFSELFVYERGLENLTRLGLIEINQVGKEFLTDVLPALLEKSDMGFLRTFLVDLIHTGEDMVELVKYIKAKCFVDGELDIDVYLQYVNHMEISNIKITRFGQDFCRTCIK